ncbi:hypothetical protein BV22DRAFT_979341, partial [Leucogyrophana mollusca]
FTRHTWAHNPKRVAYILEQVTIGHDLTPEEHSMARDFVREFADTFACTLSEVSLVPGAVHQLKIPPNAKFSLKVRQRPLSPPQKVFMHKRTKEMYKADIIERAPPAEVKCIAPTVLAQKAH